MTTQAYWYGLKSCLIYNPVVLFKQQEEEQEEEMNDIGTDNFILGLQTEFQRDTIWKQHNNYNYVDIINHYDFNL